MNESGEKMDFTFKQIEKPKNIHFLFDWSYSEPNHEIEKTAEKLLRAGVAYLREVIGADYPFPSTYKITIAGGLANAGAQMRLDRSRLLDYETADEARKDFEQSQVIHELVHNMREIEDVPMLAELAYMAEHGHVWRFNRIRELIQKGELGVSHLDGLKAVAEQLSVSLDDLLEGKVEGKTMRAALHTVGRELVDEYNEKKVEVKSEVKWNMPGKSR